MARIAKNQNAAETYERQLSQGDTRRAFHIADLGDAEANKLIAKL